MNCGEIRAIHRPGKKITQRRRERRITQRNARAAPDVARYVEYMAATS
jgi:hypothetical protein